MNNYIVSIFHYFQGYQNFKVKAENKADAIEKAKDEARIYGGGNYNLNDIKVKKVSK